MIARLAFLFFLSIGCVHGTNQRENMAGLSATEGIVVSGGFDEENFVSYASVEVFVPSTGFSCSLPALPEGRDGHTMDNWIICGGASGDEHLTSSTTCLSFISGEWITSHILVEERIRAHQLAE
eukprot:TRINITY_DN32764_c0_g1_i1.p2 TRINITY_DN32764_c0_g1~~TRINITY_DN32764_c0_g1_i1.p2  ORF type:complete len:143 (-),score=38.45 TRINITY_DN32764_c0_g1_i1:714-1085(-)